MKTDHSEGEEDVTGKYKVVCCFGLRWNQHGVVRWKEKINILRDVSYLEGFILDESATRSFIVSVMEDLKYFWSSIFM